ncbi:c-type cytochrome [Larkinella soli]|uniref:c-type cytochrome n=1 Tax=Larkinella soli TaxID=1770527 RepID=UPI000FFBE684|nr:cytochrome c [Larkinella soli]
MKFTRLNRSLLVMAAAILTITACKRGHDNPGTEFAPNMYEPVGYEPYKQQDGFKNPYNKYGANLWEPVKGTVSRRNYHTSFGKGDSAVRDLMVYNIPGDSIAISERVLKNPVPLNDRTLTEGKEYYARYCQHCHGETGKGDGLVAAQYKGVPVYSSLPPMNDGHVFHVITHGKGRMWPHGSQMTPEERWKIVHYVQKLQQG